MFGAGASRRVEIMNCIVYTDGFDTFREVYRGLVCTIIITGTPRSIFRSSRTVVLDPSVKATDFIAKRHIEVAEVLVAVDRYVSRTRLAAIW